VEFFIALIAPAALWVLFDVPILYYGVALNGLFFLIMGNVFVGVLQIVLAVAAHLWHERDRTPPATMDATRAPDTPILSAQKPAATDAGSQGAEEDREPARETPARDVFTVPSRFDGQERPEGIATTPIGARCLSKRGTRVRSGQSAPSRLRGGYTM
jgi:hypothetical protein